LSSVDLSGSGRAAGLTNARYLSWLVAFERSQVPPFTRSITVVWQGGQPVVRVEFSWPSPLGLLAAG
jgi:hypothetical protein